MQHVAVLINLISLLLGVIAGAILVTRYINHPTKLLAEFLKFFLAYSYLIIVATLFSYVIVNISADDWAQSLFACLVFLGMSFLELTLPGYIFEEIGQQVPRWFRIMTWIAAVITGLQAPVLWFTARFWGITLPLALAFLPFLVIITATLYRKAVYNKKGGESRNIKKLFLTFSFFIIIGIFAGIETIYGSYIYRDVEYIVISLPLAYSFSAIQIIRKYSSYLKGNKQFLPEHIISEYELTSREIEMAEKILDGASNKEIAYDLELSQNTVRNHIYNLYQKLGIQKRMDLLKLIKHE